MRNPGSRNCRRRSDSKLDATSPKDLLTRLIDEAYESREEVIASFRGSSVPLSAEEKAAMRRDRFNSGVETDESDIDDIIYE